jgi:cathepsin L
MKGKLFTKIMVSLAILSILFAGFYINAQATDAMKDALNKQKKNDKQTLDDLKKKLSELEAEIKEKNYAFKVGITDAMKYELEQLTGTKPPKVSYSSTNKEAEKRLKMENKRRKAKKKVKSSNDESEDDYSLYDVEDENLPDEYADLIDYSDAEQPDTIDNDGYIDTSKKKDEIKPTTCSVSSPKWDWRTEGKITPIKMQGSCGSCWAFTTAAVVETAYLIKNNKTVDLSEQQIVNCSGAGSCNGGWYEDAFKYMSMKSPYNAGKKSGILENFEPYKGKDMSCKTYSATTYQTVAWGYVADGDRIPTVKEMKQAICKYGAIASTVYATSQFQAYKSGVFNEKIKLSSPSQVNHAITLVGWDDKLNSYLLKNSWSKNWGIEGYMWIDYRTNNIGYGSMWVVARDEKAGK